MNKRFTISESEKERILKMHESFKSGYILKEEENPTVREQMNTVKPDQGCKYCFSDAKVNQVDNEYKDRSYKVYKVKKGDTVDSIAARGNSKENLLEMNDLCREEMKKGMIKAGCVVMFTTLPSGV